MILFVDDNAGVSFIKRTVGIAVWITEIIDKISKITVLLDKTSVIDGDT